MQTSDILSPMVLMIILTILHSQIVSTHLSTPRRLISPVDTSNTRSPRRESKGRRQNSVSSKPVRKNRRSSRLPPSRRRSSKVPPITFVHGPIVEYDQTQLAPPSRPSASSSSLSPSTSKKVLFLDQSANNIKSLSPSNSDKDEGIPEEIVHEHELDVHDDCNFAMTAISDPIIKKNLAETVSQYVEEQNRCMGISNGGIKPVMGNEGSNAKLTPVALRNRNLSKQSVSTTTPSPSGSAGECSTHHSSTDEEGGEIDEEADDQLSEESPCHPNGLDDDEEVRRSEWTAVTTNSEGTFMLNSTFRLLM